MNMIDDATADALGVSVEEYVREIEKIPFEIAEEIITLVWSLDEVKNETAKELYNKYKSLWKQ